VDKSEKSVDKIPKIVEKMAYDQGFSPMVMRECPL
jgi:hypothetical protein